MTTNALNTDASAINAITDEGISPAEEINAAALAIQERSSSVRALAWALDQALEELWDAEGDYRRRITDYFTALVRMIDVEGVQVDDLAQRIERNVGQFRREAAGA